MWAVLIFLLGIGGVVLINIFGNITTTNQQDYTLLKNTVEAAMWDSVDIAAYRVGFYVCSNKTTFNSKNEYQISYTNITNGDYKCNLQLGEVKLKADVFTESFLRRFAENINNNKSYKVTVQEVIEYPPKVSVRIDTYNTYNSSGSTTHEFMEGDFQIRNQIDAILENREVYSN